MFREAMVLWLVLAGAGLADGVAQPFTLYRSSLVDPMMRVHIATFDAEVRGTTYNQANCLTAADLFMSQEGVSLRFWCEPGRYAGSR
ncbi:hypothetical protein J4E08_22310 [Sagittula sp. NFXS13]|uniref:hypothetical protein n=1 Tax=Sagittula sp. NFXS13 TaxID=2819095 RepID=UPI0032E01317